MKPVKGFVIFAALGTLVPSVHSQPANVPVIDASTRAPVVQGASTQPGNAPVYGPIAQQNTSPRPVYSPPPRSSGTTSTAPAELFYQLELLQQEVQELRGIVEQQSYELGQMRAEQRDRYLDLDRRIGLLGQGAPVSQTPTPTRVGSDSPAPSIPVGGGLSTPAPSAPKNEKAEYQAAFDLIRERKYDQAIESLLQFSKDYPKGEYTGNAFYWLGEVYLVKMDRESALTSFGALLAQYPQHRKAADAKYKLGKIYRDLGDLARARELFQEVANQHAGTSAAKLAENELRQTQN